MRVSLIFFFSDNCSVCSALRDKLFELSRELEVEFVEYNLQKEKTLAAEKMVLSVPALILEVEGKEFRRWVRVFSLDELKREVNRIKELL